MKCLERSVRARKLTTADCKQRDKQVQKAIKEHEQIFGDLKRKREEEAVLVREVMPDRPKKRRISGEKGLLRENAKENVVIDGGPSTSGRCCTRAIRSRLL